MTLAEWKRQNREELRIAREKAWRDREAREAYAKTEDRLFLSMLGILFVGILSYALITYPIL